MQLGELGPIPSKVEAAKSAPALVDPRRNEETCEPEILGSAADSGSILVWIFWCSPFRLFWLYRVRANMGLKTVRG